MNMSNQIEAFEKEEYSNISAGRGINSEGFNAYFNINSDKQEVQKVQKVQKVQIPDILLFHIKKICINIYIAASR